MMPNASPLVSPEDFVVTTGVTSDGKVGIMTALVFHLVSVGPS